MVILEGEIRLGILHFYYAVTVYAATALALLTLMLSAIHAIFIYSIRAELRML